MRSQSARIVRLPEPAVRAHHVSPRRALPGDHAGHWIHHHRQWATDYLFAELPSFIAIGANEPGLQPRRPLLKQALADASTLRRWHTAQPPQGPPFVSVSDRIVMYSALGIEEWPRSRRTVPHREA
ncbi:hypothetical protein ACIQWB_23460 [Streptomyces olivaceus]|uniref:hypothetical protein n=1 Tax=Streptomyces olivaceus TaxID=47716 RepID=UPI0037F1ABB8